MGGLCSLTPDSRQTAVNLLEQVIRVGMDRLPELERDKEKQTGLGRARTTSL